MAKTQTANNGELLADEKSIELARRLGEARGNAKQWAEVGEYLRDEIIEHFNTVAANAGVSEPTAMIASSVSRSFMY